MDQLTQTVVVTLTMAMINVGGTLSLKQFAGTNREIYFIGGCAAYVAGAALYVMLLRGHDLATLSVATAILQLGLVCTLAVWLFNEPVNPVQWLGLGIGVLSMAVVMLASNA